MKILSVARGTTISNVLTGSQPTGTDITEVTIQDFFKHTIYKLLLM